LEALPEAGATKPKALARGSLDYSQPASVVLLDVGFSYPDSSERAVSDITLEVRPGQQVALIGPSGAGKSTIADLILGLLSPTEGKILVAGMRPRDVVQLTPGRLAYVPQSPGMISGTVAENIAFGVEARDVDRQSLESALIASHLKPVLANLTDGVQTDLGKRKDELSGGQIQRIGLARALYPRPGLIVMDEATSSLDAESEAEIAKALDELRGSVTVIVIAHRLNTIQHADQVFLIEDGRVSDSGTFRELVNSNKNVERLVQLMEIKKD
jgi:ATP-binding cassette subfamily C protein